MKHKRIVIGLIFVVGIAFRARDITQPVNSTSWRESDVASIARNFDREGMNILYPRIDWRGDDGYAEMEFPLFPWLIAASYRLFGPHEITGRILAFSFSLISLFVFYDLATRLLPEFCSAAALLFFALSPLPIHLATSLQPDGLMFLCYLAAALTFYRWLTERRRWLYWVALGSTALAILVKAPAAHLGLLFALLILENQRARSFLTPQVVFFAAASLAPGVTWYRHAHDLWLEYGNSLGLSNGDHWVGLSVLTDPTFVLGILRRELLFVWTETGWVLGVVAVLRLGSHRAVHLSTRWLLAIAVFYLLAAGSTSELWARYYHVVAAPPAALLFGLGSQIMRQGFAGLRGMPLFKTSAILLVIATVLVRRTGLLGNLLSGTSVTPEEVGVVAACLGFWALSALVEVARSRQVLARKNLGDILGAYFLFYSFLASYALELHQITYIFSGRAPSASYECAKKVLAPAIAEGALIVASGSSCLSRSGERGSHNASYFFYWLDRKGFNICLEEQSVVQLERYADRGAEYFVAEDWALQYQSYLRDEFSRRFELIRQCPSTLLFRLRD